MILKIQKDLWNEAWKSDPRPITKKCPECERLWPEGTNFCGFCGIGLEDCNTESNELGSNPCPQPH